MIEFQPMFRVTSRTVCCGGQVRGMTWPPLLSHSPGIAYRGILQAAVLLSSLHSALASPRNLPVLSPTPWKVAWGKAWLPLRAPCAIVSAEPDSAAVSDVVKALTPSLGTASVSTVAPAEARTVVRITSPAENSSNEDPTLDTARLGSEGYVLRISLVNRRPCISITAPTPAGRFYGSQTLCQMLLQDSRSLPECVIEDRPALAIRGIKGLWWKPEQYLEILPWLPTMKFNFLMLSYEAWPQTSSEWRKPFLP